MRPCGRLSLVWMVWTGGIPVHTKKTTKNIIKTNIYIFGMDGKDGMDKKMGTPEEVVFLGRGEMGRPPMTPKSAPLGGYPKNPSIPSIPSIRNSNYLKNNYFLEKNGKESVWTVRIHPGGKNDVF